MTHDEGSAAAIRARKAEHLELAIDPSAQSALDAGWGEVELGHASLPEIDLDDVQLEAQLLGRRLGAPLLISGMTGGHPQAETLNERLGAAAQRHGLAVGVGSQRAALVDRSLEYVRRGSPGRAGRDGDRQHRRRAAHPSTAGAGGRSRRGAAAGRDGARGRACGPPELPRGGDSARGRQARGDVPKRSRDCATASPRRSSPRRPAAE